MKNHSIKTTLIITLMVMMPSIKAAAQDWKSIFQGVASAVGEKASEKIAEKIDTLLLAGSWQYDKPDIKLESDDLLSKAGSELAVKKAEEHMVDIFNKIGINEHTVLTFNNDSTYTMCTDNRTMQGTYSLNKETRELILTSRLKFKFTAIVDQNILKPNKLSVRFKADKLMDLAKHLTGALAQKSTNKSIALANTLLGKYDGMTLGVELKKR